MRPFLSFAMTLLVTCGAYAHSTLGPLTRAGLDQLLDSTVHHWRFKLWETPGASAKTFNDSNWQTVDVGFQWWPAESTCWFRKTITVPQEVNGVPVAGSTLRLRVDMDNAADAYVNGVLEQRFTGAGGDFVLTKDARPGEMISVALHGINHPGYGSLRQAYFECDTSKPMVDALRQLRGDLDRAASDAQYVPRREAAHWKRLMRRALASLDLRAYRAADTAKFLASVKRAQQTLVSDAASVNRRLARTAEVLRRVKARIAEGHQRGLELAYATADARVVQSFMQYARDDLAETNLEHQIRGIKITAYIQRLAVHALHRANRIVLRDPTGDLRVPKYHTGPFSIHDGAFWQGGRPIFFTGVGHFGQVRKDIPILNDYGLNIIQIEMGPSEALPDPDTVDREAIRKSVVEPLDNAAAHNVAVNLLISPHYFPKWALERDPKLAKCGMGFLHYCIEAPDARAVIEKYLRALMPMIKGHPALHSICLSNEPQYTGKCAYTLAHFHRWLKQRHGTIAALNRAYGAHYASFDAVPIPDNASNYPLYFDFCIFNQDRFLQFHEFERDIIHEYAPNLPVHAKVMSQAFDDPSHFAAGINHEDFNHIGRIAGNDCGQMFAHKGEAYSQEWQGMALNYTLQHSTAPDAPIFNSEDHIIADRDPRYIPAAQIRTAIYTQALHGQGASTTWVWERQQQGDLGENILTRPDCVRALGDIGLDLNRLAPEIHALQETPAQVAILYSWSSFPATPEYVKETKAVFEGLYFSDTVCDFITERQCLAGKLGRYKLVIVANAPNVPTKVIEAFQKYVGAGGSVVTIGDCFSHNQYGRQAGATLHPAGAGRLTAIAPDETPKAYRDRLLGLLVQSGVTWLARLTDAHGGAVWGVNLRAVEFDGKLLASLVNFSRSDQRVILKTSNYNGLAINRFTGRKVRFPLLVKPLEPILLAIAPKQ